MINQTISHYKILEKLGAGGMGVVYKALDTRLHRVVALKFLSRSETAPADAAIRFGHEAFAAAALNHPNIATIYEYDEALHPIEHEPVAFIAMEYVEGTTLRERLAAGPLPVNEALAITLQLIRGLEAAHQQGIVHRDIKPGNVMITAGGVVKILDFGVAKSFGDTSVTDADHIVGSLAYMSPEQLTGETVDAQSDIWSFGVVVFEMLTGRHPFRGELPPALMYSIVHEEPAELAELRPEAPPVLALICRRCLEKPKIMRPQTMAEIREMLEGNAPDILTPSGRWRIRRKRTALLTGGVLLLAALLLWILLRPSGEGPPAGWRLVVMPFENQTGENLAAGWGSAIQSLMVRELTGVQGIAVIDPSTVNGYLESSFGTPQPKRGTALLSALKATGFTVLIDGDITKVAERYNIQTRVVQPGTGELLMSTTQSVAGEGELASAITKASQAVLDLYQVRVLHSAHEQDLRPWISTRKQDITAVKEFVQASDILYKGDRGADGHLRRALELDSMFLTARIWLVSSLVGNGRLEEAHEQLRFLGRHQQDASPFEQAMIRWAEAYRAGDTVAQARELERALEYSPGNNILLFNLAIVRFRMGRYEAAISALKPAVDLKWKFSTAHFLLAACYTAMRRYREAQEVLEASLAITPVYRDTYGLLALTRYRSGDSLASRQYEEKFMERAREMGDRTALAFADLGDMYRDDSAYAKAAACYGRALAADPSIGSLHLSLGTALLSLGRRDSARQECLRALGIDSLLAEAHWVLGNIAEADRDTAGAVEYFRKYLTQSNDGVRAALARERMLTLTRDRAVGR